MAIHIHIDFLSLPVLVTISFGLNIAIKVTKIQSGVLFYDILSKKDQKLIKP